MSEFDYDVFGSEEIEEVPKKVEKPVKAVKEEVAKEVKKAEPKKVKTVKPKAPEPKEYEVFETEGEEPVKSAEKKTTKTDEQYDVFGGADETTAKDTGYYDVNDGGYQDAGGSGNRRPRATQAGEAAGLAAAAVAGAAISRSNKVPKAVKNAINPNYQNEKKKAEEQQFLNARKARQAKYEQRAAMAAKSAKKPFYKKWWFWVIIAFLVLILAVGACGGDTNTDTATTTAAEETVATTTTTTVRTYSFNELEVKKDEADGQWYAYAGDEKAVSYTGFAQNANGLWYIVNGKVDFSKSGTESYNGKEYVINGGKATEKTTTTKPTTSFSQRNALNKANDYLDYTAFSRKGLIKQLEFEGFSNADATWAVDNCGADWNEQAYKKAKDYLDYSSFSHSGLVDQLEYEGFTSEQAEYGVNKVGL